MPRRLGQGPLVGRLTEISVLDEALRMSAEASEAGPVAVVIAGDAGIGKSRLVTKVSTRAAAAGWQVLNAGCLDLAEGSVPYLHLSMPWGTYRKCASVGPRALAARYE